MAGMLKAPAAFARQGQQLPPISPTSPLAPREHGREQHFPDIRESQEVITTVQPFYITKTRSGWVNDSGRAWGNGPMDECSRRIVDWVEQYAAGGRPAIDAEHWQQRLYQLATRHGVPGAALGIMRIRPGRDDERVELATGLVNKETGVEATPDSVFQIGSMTKVWTATVVMQLVDEGKLDLDAPVRDVMPELKLANADVAETVTMRHLLTHTSGIDGDVFTDTGRGDDCLEKYAAALEEAAQNHPLGATWSYCNSGFSLTGRVIEKVTEGTWDAAIQQRLTPGGIRKRNGRPGGRAALEPQIGSCPLAGHFRNLRPRDQAGITIRWRRRYARLGGGDIAQPGQAIRDKRLGER